MRLRNIIPACVIMLLLGFTAGTAGAVENGTADETPVANMTGTPTETLTATPAPTETPEEDDDEAYDEGMIGPGNALYGLKIAFENIGEVFTFDPDEKLGLQVSHARKRIAEARAALKRNDTDAANKAFAKYEAKLDDLNGSMSRASDNDTGLIHAKQMILKHQLILANLSQSHPNSRGLQKAYNNSKELEEKFALKIERKEQKSEAKNLKEDREIESTEDAGRSTQDTGSEQARTEKIIRSDQNTRTSKGPKRSD